MESSTFIRNPQIFLRVTKTTRFKMLLLQTSDWQYRRTACIFVLESANPGTHVTGLRNEDIVTRSHLSMSVVELEVTLEPMSWPYIIVCSHTNSLEGYYTLVVEGSDEFLLRTMDNCIAWFEPPLSHRTLICGEWKGSSAAGTIVDEETGQINRHWIYSPQFPIIISETTRCLLTMRKTKAEALMMGVIVVKSWYERGRYDNYQLQEEDVIAQYLDYTSMDEFEMRMFLHPRKEPYIIIPLVNIKGRESTFEIMLESDQLIERVEFFETESFEFFGKGTWIRRKSGGLPTDSNFYNCPQFLIQVSKDVSISIYLEQLVEIGMLVNACFYIIRGSKKITKSSFDKNNIIFQRTWSLSALIHSEVTLKKGSYIIIPCPRTSTFGRDIPIILRVISSDVDGISMEELKNKGSFIYEKILDGEWNMITSGGRRSSSGFFFNPQYEMIIAEDRTHIEITLDTSDNEMMTPGSFFIFRQYEGMDWDGNFADTSEEGIVFHAEISSGTSVTSILNFDKGNYRILCASLVPGKSGYYRLRLNSTKPFEASALRQPFFTESIEESLDSDQCGWEPEDPHFDNNPRYKLMPVNNDQNVSEETIIFVHIELLGQAERPATPIGAINNRNAIRLLVYDGFSDDNIRYVSSACEIHCSSLFMTLQRATAATRSIVVASRPGIQANFRITVQSSSQAFHIVPDTKVKQREIGEIGLEDVDEEEEQKGRGNSELSTIESADGL